MICQKLCQNSVLGWGSLEVKSFYVCYSLPISPVCLFLQIFKVSEVGSGYNFTEERLGSLEDLKSHRGGHRSVPHTHMVK